MNDLRYQQYAFGQDRAPAARQDRLPIDEQEEMPPLQFNRMGTFERIKNIFLSAFRNFMNPADAEYPEDQSRIEREVLDALKSPNPSARWWES